MKKIECDRCGKQAEVGMDGGFYTLSLAPKKESTLGKSADLCKDCADHLIEIIRRGVVLPTKC